MIYNWFLAHIKYVSCVDCNKIMLFHNFFDKKYIIYTIRAINIVDNKNQCLKIKNEIVMDMKPLFKNADFQEGSQKHFVYKDSMQYISQFSFGNDATVSDHARVECLILGKKDKKNYCHISIMGFATLRQSWGQITRKCAWF